MIVGNYKIKFYHNTESNHINLKEEIKKLKLVGASSKDIKEAIKLVPVCYTKVQIFRNNELLVTSTFYCSLLDNFSRAVGRWHATKRALSSYKIPDSDSKLILDALQTLPSAKRISIEKFSKA